MKIFVFSKSNMIFYSVLSVFLLCLITIRNAGYTQTANTNARLLPIYSVETQEKCISITFDSAWGDEDSEQILQALTKNDVRATFFVTGDYLDRCASSAKMFFDGGHEIANHSDMHPHPNKLGKESLIDDTKKCEEKITALTGKNTMLYRAPYGEYNNDTVSTINSMGYSFIQWDVDSLDYKGLSEEQICKRICERVKKGSIILFHTGTKNTASALEMVLPILKDQGYTFKPVSELIYKENFYIDHSGRQTRKAM